MNAKDTLKKISKRITPAYLTKLAVLTAISFLLYFFAKFSLPFMFPSFLDMQFSELPAILAGFSLGPVAGVLVIILKCLLKFPFTSTAFVGEITDMVLGVLYVLPASILYHFNKSKKNALVGLIVGTVCSTVGALILNRFVSVPFYVEFFFHGNFETIVNMCKPLYPSVTKETFYLYYLSAAVLPFNILRLFLVSFITFLVYKRLSGVLHWEIKSKKSKEEAPEEDLTPEMSSENTDVTQESEKKSEE